VVERDVEEDCFIVIDSARKGGNVPQVSRSAEAIDVTFVLGHQTGRKKDTVSPEALTERLVGFRCVEIDPVSFLRSRSEKKIGPAIVVMVAMTDYVYKRRSIAAKRLNNLLEVFNAMHRLEGQDNTSGIAPVLERVSLRSARVKGRIQRPLENQSPGR